MFRRSTFKKNILFRFPWVLFLCFWLWTSIGLFFPQAAFANEAPTAVSLEDSEVAENQPVGTVVGTLSSTDPDSADTHSYSLVSGPGSDDNALFAIGGISGDELQTGVIFDDEAGGTYSVRVRSTDDGSGNLYFEQQFTIYITHQVTIAWNPSFSPAVVGYEVSWGTESGQYGSSQDAGNELEDAISGLRGNTLYYIAVRAYDSNGFKSGYSEEIIYKKSYPDNPGTISGTVNRFSDTALEPVFELPVCAIDSVDNFWAACAHTLADGSYEIENLPAGSYIVRAVADDFKLLGQYFPDAVDQSAAEIISIGVAEPRTGINFVLNQGAVIAGALYYNGDPPVENPIVYVEDSETNYVYDGITQPNGSYSVSGLPAGSYRVRVETQDSGYIRQYYSNAYDYDSSELVETLIEQPPSDINFMLTTNGLEMAEPRPAGSTR